MSLSFTAWMIPGFVGACAAGLASHVALRRRPRPGARELAILAAAMAWWCLLQVVVLAAPTLEGKVLASKIQYLGVVTVPLAWLWFATAYASCTPRIPPIGWALLAAPEAATLLLAWTNEWHGLVWKRLFLVPAGSFSLLRIDYGAWFRVHVYYAYALIAAAICTLAYSLLQSPHRRRRALLVVVSPLLPVAANRLYLGGATPDRWVDLTPSGLALAGLVLTWSLLCNDLLDLPPVTRSRVLDAISDGVLVVDPDGRVLDQNPAAARLLGCRIGDTLPGPLLGPGRRAEGAGEAGPGTVPRETAEVEGRTMEITRSPARYLPAGAAIVVVRDVTERDRLQRELRAMGEELVRANAELVKLAATDELTGLANRRHLFHTLEQELRRSARYGRPLSLLLLDIDNFKRINDSLGHNAGDLLLRGIASIIQGTLREADTVARIGGDEIAIVLPETGREGAQAIARRILARVAKRTFHTPGGTAFSATVSVGVVVAEAGSQDAGELLHRADVALYAAKRGGRNRMRLGAASG